ncbi:MAG: PfkB family carbohydrate kinase [Acidimicrobiales bacterium]
MNQKRVVVVGDAMVDVVVRALEPVHLTSDTASKVRLGRGGSAANIAVELALDHHVAFVGAVGEDPAGEIFLADLRASDVTPLVQILPGATGVVVAFVNDDGQRAMLTDRGVNARLDGDAVREALVVPFDHLHVSGYTFLDPRTRTIAMDCLAYARQLGSSTSVDVCSVAPLRQLGAAKFLRATGRVTMLFANEEEACALGESRSLQRALTAIRPYAEEVVVTLGDRGALVVSDGELVRKPSREVDVVDTTGAGDAATGAYLSKRLSGRSRDQSLELAMSRASKVVRRLGSRA